MLEEFNISLQDMEKVSRRLLDQMNKGLESEVNDSKVKMLITYVHSLPDGSENGDFLALDLGEYIMPLHMYLQNFLLICNAIILFNAFILLLRW